MSTPVKDAFQELLAACKQGKAAEIKRLAPMVADINAINTTQGLNQHTFTPLTSVFHPRDETIYACVNTLLDAGANPNTRDGYKVSPILAHKDNTSVVKLLLSRGADLMATDEYGEPDLVKLIKNGRNVIPLIPKDLLNYKNPYGNTIMMTLLGEGHPGGWYRNVVLELLDAGADVTHRNTSGKNALDIAREQGLPSALILKLELHTLQEEMKVKDQRICELEQQVAELREQARAICAPTEVADKADIKHKPAPKIVPATPK